MPGLTKVLIFAVLVLAAWWLWRTIQRRGVSGIFRSPANKKTGAQAPKALDMEKCRICGDFVPDEARACANQRCPYPVA